VRRGKKAKDRNQKSRRWEGIRKEERGRRCAVIGLRLEAEGREEAPVKYAALLLTQI